jgi:hypothetical protein
MELMNWADALIERIDLMAEVDALAERVEATLSLWDFETVPVEFEPYDTEGVE